MRYALATLLFLHGLIHLLGASKAIGWADVSSIRQHIDKPFGVAWLLAAILLTGAAAMLAVEQHWWWVAAIAGAALSQWLISTVWSDAKFGTIANVVIVLPLLMALNGRLALT